jgi:hypothetical protein
VPGIHSLKLHSCFSLLPINATFLRPLIEFLLRNFTRRLRLFTLREPKNKLIYKQNANLRTINRRTGGDTLLIYDRPQSLAAGKYSQSRIPSPNDLFLHYSPVSLLELTRSPEVRLSRFMNENLFKGVVIKINDTNIHDEWFVDC